MLRINNIFYIVGNSQHYFVYLWLKMEITNIYHWSDSALLKQLGEYLRKSRLQQNKTQEDIASSAGLNRTTLVQMEKGNGGTLNSFIRVLRSLNKLEVLGNFSTEETISPLLMAKEAMKARKRVRAKKRK